MKHLDEILFDIEIAKKISKKNKSKFDMKKFKEYVKTYDAKKNGLDNDDTIVKDMIYGIGLCLNKKEFQYADGFSKFKTFIKSFL
jgi:hypothetical protein